MKYKHFKHVLQCSTNQQEHVTGQKTPSDKFNDVTSRDVQVGTVCHLSPEVLTPKEAKSMFLPEFSEVSLGANSG